MPISHAKSDAFADWSGTVTIGNSTGGTTTAAGSDLVRPSDWNSNHLVSLSASEVAGIFNFAAGLSSTTAAGGISVGVSGMPFYEPFPLPNTNSTLSAPGIGTWYFDGPYLLDNGLPKGQFNVPVSNAAGFLAGGVFSAAQTGSVSKYQTLYHHLALYSQGAGAQSSRLESSWTMSNALIATESWGVTSTASDQVRVTHHLSLSFPAQWDTAGGCTYSTASTSSSKSTQKETMVSSTLNASIAAANSYVSGARMDIIAFSTTLPPGVYWLAHMFTSTSSTAGSGHANYVAGTMISTQSVLGLLENALSAYKRLGLAVSNATTNMMPFHGYLATVSSQASSIVNITDILNTTGRMYWNFQQSTY